MIIYDFFEASKKAKETLKALSGVVGTNFSPLRHSISLDKCQFAVTFYQEGFTLYFRCSWNTKRNFALLRKKNLKRHQIPHPLKIAMVDALKLMSDFILSFRKICQFVVVFHYELYECQSLQHSIVDCTE